MVIASSQNSLTTLAATSSSNAPSKVDKTATGIAAIQLGTAIGEVALGTATSVDISSFSKAAWSFEYGAAQVAHAEDAGRGMETIKKELGKVDALIAKRRPDLAGANWDFKLVDGKFKVTGLSQDDAKWLETKLNANSALRGAAQSFMATATADLETSSSNPARQDFNFLTGHMENYTFYKVGAQLADKLSFKSLLSQSDQIFDSSRISLPAYDRGTSGLAVAATLLTASNPPIEGRTGAFYSTKYDPHQS